MIKAIIFDMDGVLVNTEIEYIKQYKTFLEECKVPTQIEELYFLAGSSRKIEHEFLVKKTNYSMDEIIRLKDNYFATHPLNYSKLIKPYVREILEYLKEKNIKVALASSSPMKNILEVLDQCDIRNYFSFITSGEYFQNTKPDPEIYEFTVKELNIDKKEIIVVEDSNYGIEAAKRANLKVVAVLDPILNFDTQLADYKIKSLKELKDIIQGEIKWLEL